MEVADIIKRLQQLQLEESNLLAELAARERDIEAPRAHPQLPSQRRNRATDRKQLEIGDKVLLLTGGVRCRKGDTATVTKVSPKTIHFTVHRTGHTTHKRVENVRKITPDTQS